MKNILICLVSFICFSMAWAEETPFELQSKTTEWNSYGVESQVVYNKKYPHQKSQEISLLGNLYFRNDLNSTVGIGGTYTYHFNEYHSWEALHVTYLKNSETRLREEIQEKTGLVPQAENNEFLVSSAYALHPTYGKIAWFGKKIIHFDNYVLVGAGIRKLVESSTLKPLGLLGVGFRFYLSDQLALKLEARDFIFNEVHESGNEMIHAFVPTIGLSFKL